MKLSGKQCLLSGLLLVAVSMSGMAQYWQQRVDYTMSIDFDVEKHQFTGNQTLVYTNNSPDTLKLENMGSMPMPVELVITFADEDKKPECYRIPLQIMRGEKPDEHTAWEWKTAEDWPWTYPEYTLELPYKMEDIKSIEIDPLQRVADVDRSNNVFPTTSTIQFPGKVK